PNGAGKTTTLRLLCALIAPSSGRAEVGGFRLGRDDGQIRSIVGILTEQPGLYERQSAWDNLVFFGTLYGLSAGTARVQTERFLRLMGLWERRGDAVATFSRGMKQKMAIARAALHEPRILFLDEPTTGLDPDAAKTVREFIIALRGEGRTVFLCTHNLDEADRLCDRIAFFRHRVIRTDTADQLRAARRGSRARPRGPGRARRALRERIDHRRDARSAAHESAPRARARGRRSADRVRHRAQAASRGRVPADRRGTGMTATSGPLAVVARHPDRATLVRAVCIREWKEALGNRLLVGMTLLPPVVILAAGIVAVAAAAA